MNAPMDFTYDIAIVLDANNWDVLTEEQLTVLAEGLWGLGYRKPRPTPPEVGRCPNEGRPCFCTGICQKPVSDVFTTDTANWGS